MRWLACLVLCGCLSDLEGRRCAADGDCFPDEVCLSQTCFTKVGGGDPDAGTNPRIVVSRAGADGVDDRGATYYAGECASCGDGECTFVVEPDDPAMFCASIPGHQPCAHTLPAASVADGHSLRLRLEICDGCDDTTTCKCERLPACALDPDPG